MAATNKNPPPGRDPVLSQNALIVLQSRYLIRDAEGNCIETPAELFGRVATLVAEAEAKYGAPKSDVRTWRREYYDLMASLKFLPNSPALMNAGRRGMLSACFVLPVEDSIEGIFEAIKQTALIQQAGGGTGFSFDKLRPTGDRVASSGGTTSGPVSFWRVFSETTEAIQQGAFRRGANMGMMSVEHPDILKFLQAKQNLKVFTNFNISVKVTDAWMRKVLRSGRSPHIVTNPRTQQKYLLPRRIDLATYTISDLHELPHCAKAAAKGARGFYTVADLWELLIRCARDTGEPGLAFIDRINRDNPTPTLGPIEATNPCGEQPLLPYEACTLGSINLAKFVKPTRGRSAMDWRALGKTVALAVRFLDNIIDAGSYPIDETHRLARANRKIGLGVMGFADSLFMLGMPYDSPEGVEFAGRVMKFINERARKAGAELAKLRGTFPNWQASLWRRRRKKLRNAAMTCVAPTGTISIIADCSCGIEPAYALVFRREVLEGTKLLEVNPIFKSVAQETGFYSKKLEKKIARAGTIQNIKEIPARIRRVFRCAYDIKPDWHIKMQAAFQAHCDAAVSKTINLPADAGLDAVDRAYKKAYRLGCKGITVYRQASRPHEPMTLY